MTTSQPEVWLRGPVPGIAPLLQPIAHALLAAREEVEAIAADLPGEILWTRPGGVACAGFHLQHIAGVLDRLFTYARGESLHDGQRAALREEADPGPAPPTLEQLLDRLRRQVDLALEQLRATEEADLTRPREVGRARLPSNTFGLLMHAAEHSQRHVGQLLVTVTVQRGQFE